MQESPGTEARIKAHLLELLETTPYSKIKMTGIAAGLDMTRQNIYKYYSTKDDILHEIAEEMLDQVVDYLEQTSFDSSPETWNEFVDKLLENALTHQDVVRSILRSDTDEIAFQFIRSFATRVLGRIARLYDIQIRDHNFFNIVVLDISASLFHIAKSWAKEGNKISREKVRFLMADNINPTIVTKLRLCERIG